MPFLAATVDTGTFTPFHTTHTPPRRSTTPHSVPCAACRFYRTFTRAKRTALPARSRVAVCRQHACGPAWVGNLAHSLSTCPSWTLLPLWDIACLHGPLGLDSSTPAYTLPRTPLASTRCGQKLRLLHYTALPAFGLRTPPHYRILTPHTARLCYHLPFCLGTYCHTGLPLRCLFFRCISHAAAVYAALPRFAARFARCGRTFRTVWLYTACATVTGFAGYTRSPCATLVTPRLLPHCARFCRQVRFVRSHVFYHDPTWATKTLYSFLLSFLLLVGQFVPGARSSIHTVERCQTHGSC